jgi:2-phosphoglycerate kinase
MSSSRVLLIGGPPGAGKTTLGRAIAAELGYASLTVDDLAVAVRAMTTPEAVPALYPMAGIGHTRYFTEGPPHKLVADAEALEEALWPAVRAVARTHALIKESIVIDWWLLGPDLVATLEEENVASLWVYIDPVALDQRERRNTWFREGSSDPERMHTNFMHRSLWRNEHVADRARKLGLPVLHQTGDIPTSDLVLSALDLVGWNSA